ncbi:RNase H domain-containing protein [Abeliophyllum distichum]|uniref:RNase H domain-containing protein n=1 Tax=Abeliophyllum distichum TaxID=126358 RepID=A0ABD1STY0_9LAMI
MGTSAKSTPNERLVSIKEGRTESLRSYMDRFSKRLVEVDKIFDNAALIAVLSGLRTKTAEKATSNQENEKSDQRDNIKGKEKDSKPEKKKSPKKAPNFQHPCRPRPTQRFQGYHILNTSLENILMQTKRKDILKKPVSMRASSSELNQRKYCRYHRFTGHDTDDCQDLKGEIESLIRYCQVSIAKLVMEKFSFSEEDAFDVLQPHSDALVITMPVSGINIHRILVDDRSSVNVLSLRTFRQMEIDVRHIRPFSKPLQRFTEDYVNPKG